MCGVHEHERKHKHENDLDVIVEEPERGVGHDMYDDVLDDVLCDVVADVDGLSSMSWLLVSSMCLMCSLGIRTRSRKCVGRMVRPDVSVSEDGTNAEVARKGCRMEDRVEIFGWQQVR